MSSQSAKLHTVRVSRRTFLVQSGFVSCGVAFGLGGCVDDSKDSAASSGTPGQGALAFNSWVTLYADGSIDVIAPGIELGQGSVSTLPRYVAEELDADWNRVRVIPAPADQKRFGNPLFFGFQGTAGSRTCMGYFDVMRIAGAQARYVLLTTAARNWRVPIDQLTTDSGFVTHTASQRRIGYGELISAAEVPEEFPLFIAPDGKPQETDDLFGDPPPPPAVHGSTRLPPIKLKSRKQFKLLGVDAPRIDIPSKVNGAAQYGIDVQLPGTVYAEIETGPARGSAPGKVDDFATRSSPGVIDVIRLPYGVAIVATDRHAAHAGRKRLKVSWQPAAQSHGYDSDKVLADFARIAAESERYPGVRVFEFGDPAATLAALASHPTVIFEGRSELVYHAPMEPQSATVRVSPDGKSAEAWVSTQWPRMDQEYVAKILNIEPDSVKLNMAAVGGSFGRRQEPGAVVDATYIAQRTGKTVKVMWTREDDLKREPYRQAAVCRIEAAVGGDGRIIAMRHRVVADSWLARVFPSIFEHYNQSDVGNWVGARHLYDVPLQIIDSVTEYRGIDVCYMRGIGCTQTKFAQESLIDDIATRNGKDPLEYRLAMLKKHPRAIQVLQTVAQMGEWTRKRKGRALGVAYTHYGNSHAALIAEVSVSRRTGEIRVHNVWCAVDVGFAVQPAIVASQIEGGILQGMSMALFEKITIRGGVPQETNLADYRILRMSEAPDVFVRVLPTDNAVTGAAEIGVMQIAPAINNAVWQLIGARLHTMPMVPEQVLKVMRA